LYERCPKAYEFRYVKQYPLAASWAIRGRAVHAALEYNFTQKIETGTDRPVAECVDLFHETVRQAFSPMAPDEVVLFPGESEDRIRKEGAAALSAYLRELAPTIHPVMVEESLELTLPSGLRLRGRVDLVDDHMRIRDAKTTTDPMNPETLHYHAQPALYGALLHSRTGHYPGFVFDVVSLGRGKEPHPRAASIPFQVTAALVTARLADLTAVDAQITQGRFPRRPSEMNCTKCVYKPACWSGILPPKPEALDPDLTSALQASVAAVSGP
jgi:hypothetical protein